MNFLTPAAFFLSLLLPLIVIMYLLKLRRTEQQVSSVYLWRQLVRDVEANAPWQRLRRNLLMILQLLFLFLLIITLSQPFIWTEGTGGKALILVLDTSASMASVDSSPSRLEAAKDQAHSFVDDIPEGTRVTVITTGAQTQVLVASSQDKRAIHQVINSIQVSMASSDLTTALQLTSAIASRQPDTDIVILSDGQVTLPDRLGLKGRLRYYPIGTSEDNQAVSNLTINKSPSGENSTLFAQVTNYSSQAVTRRLEIYADGVLVDALDLDLEPGQQRAYLHEGLAAETQLVEARLNGPDTLPLDDSAWAVGTSGGPVGVTLVSTGNRFLEVALGLLPNVTLTTISPEDYELTASPPSDLTIFDAYLPSSGALPEGSLLFIAPPASTAYFSVIGSVEQPKPRHVELTDPLLANISMAGVTIMDSSQILLPVWGRTIIAGDTDEASVPLLVTGNPEGRKVAILAFNLQRSDLPLQLAFPVLVANLIDWLAPDLSGGLLAEPPASATLSAELPLEAESITITQPDGSTLQMNTPANRSISLPAMQPGIYQIEWGEDGRLLTPVNLFSPQESRVKPVQQLSIIGAGNGAGDNQQQAQRILWRPFALAALAFLVAEWLVYQRSTLARIWTTIRQRLVLRWRGGETQ